MSRISSKAPPTSRPPTPPSHSTLALARELMRYRPRLFAVCCACWTAIHAFPVVFGLLIGWMFDALLDESFSSAWVLVGVFTFLAIARHWVIWTGDVRWADYWNDQGLQVRRNMLRWLLEADGSRAMTAAPGEAVSTFRDDVDDLLEYMEFIVDSGGIAIFSIGSVTVMAIIDPVLTAILLVPMLFVVFAAQALGPQIRIRRRAMREATEEVTGLIGESFGAVQSIKLAAAEQPMLDELGRRNEVRRKAALRDTFLTEALTSMIANMATLTIAVVLLVSTNRLIDGSLTVGELVVFLTYLPRLTWYLSYVGRFIAQHRRTGVAYDRIRALAVDADDEQLLDRTRVPLEGELGELPPQVRLDDDRLQRLDVSGLSFTYPDRIGRAEPEGEHNSAVVPTGDQAGIHEAGIDNVSFVVERGSFTVIAGRVGSGKTSILRAMLGLIPSEGEVRWNGRLVNDRASFLVPPRSAYTPQIPKLVSDTLAYNISLREAAAPESVHAAARLAVLDADLGRLPGGIETMVGARGVKLSGGQVQRSAVARMFATTADLLVFDDLSSALDLHTEAELWDRLFANREVTCLVVSHRPTALQRADQILVVEDGRVTDNGRLEELLERSAVMNELWEAGR